MRNVRPRQLRVYRTQDGREPFSEWLKSIRDKETKNRIQRRLDQIENGNLGDYRSVGESIFEIRFHFGTGYRIYFGVVENTIILLLCGGDKSSQTRDIERAKTYWLGYKEMQS